MSLTKTERLQPARYLALIAGLLVTVAGVANVAEAGVIYRCESASGVIEYSNSAPAGSKQCKKIALPTITTIPAPKPVKAAARKGTGRRNSKKHGDQCRKGRLHKRETHRRPIRRPQPIAATAPGHHQSGAQRQANHQPGGNHAGPAGQGGYCDSAARHSATAASRSSAASSGASNRAFATAAGSANPSGRPPSGVTTGNIQLVVGITP